MLILVQVIDKSFGFDTAVEEAQRAINAAHVEAESIENGIGLVKLMGRQSGICLVVYNHSRWNPGNSTVNTAWCH